jgi:NodT family efflux transporter outer membrane factor (OMF) lipoprotein
MSLISKLRKTRGSAAWALVLMAGCSVGPNFKKPAPPEVKSFTAEPLATTTSTTNSTAGESQRFVEGMDVAGDWWSLFHSKPLNDLIERSLKNNPNLKAAQAALKIATENVKAQRGNYYPAVNGGFAASRQKTSEQLAPTPNANVFQYNLFTPQVSVSYVPDVFGFNRRSVESLVAQAEGQRFALAATYITLSANVVAAAVQEASLREQINATTNLVAASTKALEILRAQFASGSAGRLDLAAQESQLAQVIATLPPLVKQLAQQRDQLAVLAGAFPSQQPGETFDISGFELPRELPLTVPSKLVAQRPDVRQAEENFHSMSAQIGVAVANRLPNITLSASMGSTALAADQLFSSGTGFWGIGAAATQPIFQGGTLLHREKAARAAFLQATEQYRATVLAAFQNVADTLNALEQDAQALKASAEAERAAKVTLEITQKQLQSGYANYLALVTAEQTYQQAVMNLVQAKANRFSDTAALFLALGGGWWNRGDITKN